MDRPEDSQSDLTATLDARVFGRLRQLRTAIRLRLAGEAVAWLVVALMAGVLVTLAVDWALKLDRPQRALVMAAAVAVVAWIIWRALVRPLRVPLPARDLSLLVERRFPSLRGRLASAVEFATRPLASGLSSAMAARVASEAVQLSEDVRFTDVVERRRMHRAWRTALSAIGLIVGFGIWQGDVLTLWAQRHLLLAETPWPQRTYLTVSGRDFTVVRGDDLHVDVLVEAGSEAPAAVAVHARYPSVGWTQEQVEPTDDPRRFDVVFHQVTEPIRFFVTGGDDARDKRRPHDVRLIEPPALVQATFVVESPAYAKRPPQRVAGATAVLPAPVGGAVRIDAVANKALSSATAFLTVDGDDPTSQPLRIGPGDDPAEDARRVTGRLALPTRNEPQTLRLDIGLTDMAGHASRRGGKVVIRLQPDLAPSVKLRRTGIGPAVTPNALLPLRMAAEDDAALAGLAVQLRRDESADLFASEPAPLPAGDPPRQTVAVEHALDLAGRRLAAGQMLRIAVEAVDTLPEAFGGPNYARSNELTFRLVTPEDLLADLIARQKALRAELLQARSQQETARAHAAAAATALGEDPMAGRAALTASMGIQGSVRAESAKIAERLRLIAAEMVHNRLNRAADVEVLRADVIGPLARLDDEMARLADDLQAAQELADADASARVAADVAAGQGRVATELDVILQRMIKLHSRQELASQLQVILQWSRDILGQIQQRQQRQIDEVIGGDDGDN